MQRNTIKEENTMRKEVIVSAKTVDEAAAQGAQMLGVDVADVTFEVLTQPKKRVYRHGRRRREA